jgi:hypothetical protein
MHSAHVRSTPRGLAAKKTLDLCAVLIRKLVFIVGAIVAERFKVTFRAGCQRRRIPAVVGGLCRSYPAVGCRSYPAVSGVALSVSCGFLLVVP